MEHDLFGKPLSTFPDHALRPLITKPHVVGVIQAFNKLSFLHELAPTGSEPPFLIAQVIVLVFFVVLGFLAARRFHPQFAKA